MASTNGNGNGSIDTHIGELGSAAETVLKGMEQSGRNEHTVVDLTQYAGGHYRRPAALQRFGQEVMPELTGSGVIKKVGTKPTMYAITPQGYALLKSSQTP